jgi:hypothetical protein
MRTLSVPDLMTAAKTLEAQADQYRDSATKVTGAHSLSVKAVTLTEADSLDKVASYLRSAAGRKLSSASRR